MSNTKSIWRGPIINSSALSPDQHKEAHGDSHSSLTLCDCTGWTVLLMKAHSESLAAAALGLSQGQSIRPSPDVVLSRTGPTEWIALGTPESTQAVEFKLLSADDSALALDVSHGVALFRLSGERATDLLSKLCSIDLHESEFSDSSVRVTLVAKTLCTLTRDDQREPLSYLIQCNRSLGQYLWEQLIDAGLEFGIVAQDSGAT